MILLLLFATLAAAQEKAGQITRSIPPAYVVDPGSDPSRPDGFGRTTEVEAQPETIFDNGDFLKTGPNGRLQAREEFPDYVTQGESLEETAGKPPRLLHDLPRRSSCRRNADRISWRAPRNAQVRLPK